jgi:hypothetical protein
MECKSNFLEKENSKRSGNMKKIETNSSKFGQIYLYTKGRAPRKILFETAETRETAMIEMFCEPPVSEWFTKTSWWEDGWILNEIETVIPDWDSRIGSSVRNIITDEKGKLIAFLEIKVPKKIYGTLTRARQFKTEICDHIPFVHYCQMQGNMFILDVKTCFYVVLGRGEMDCNTKKLKPTQIYIEKVDRNDFFWKNKLYPAINLYIS